MAREREQEKDDKRGWALVINRGEMLAVQEAVRRGDISAGAAYIYNLVAYHSTDMGEDAYMGKKKLATALGKSKRTVQRWFKELKNSGLLVTEKKELNGRMRTVNRLTARGPARLDYLAWKEEKEARKRAEIRLADLQEDEREADRDRKQGKTSATS